MADKIEILIAGDQTPIPVLYQDLGHGVYTPATIAVAVAAVVAAVPVTYVFVSKSGNNTNGQTWATAWNELNQINWIGMTAGTIVLIDGGPTSMTYLTTLTVAASGTTAQPILIQMAYEIGRNGQVIIDGGRSLPLPYWGQASYTGSAAAISYGLRVLSGIHDVVIDGTKWHGIIVRATGAEGVRYEDATVTSIVLRNADIYDCGSATQSAGAASQIPAAGLWYPDRPGVRPAGQWLHFERCVIHDNGEDAFQTDQGNVQHMFLKESWLYNSRLKGDGSIFNAERHPDGLQLYGAAMTDLQIDRSVIGPYVLQSMALGDSSAVVNNLSVSNSLLYGTTGHNVADNNGSVAPTGYVLTNVTSDMPAGTNGQVDIKISNGQITATDSIFTGGGYWSSGTGTYSGNYVYNVPGSGGPPRTADPQYADGAAYGSRSLTASFALAGGSPAAGKGSAITSSTQLLALP